jgi:hypothetical protein
MNVELGTEAAQFSEKKYINGIFVAVRNTLGGVSFWYGTDCAGCPFSCTGPASCPGRSSVISGELQARGNSICLCSYAPPPPRRPLDTGQLPYTFVIHILSTYRSNCNFKFSVCCYSRYLFWWVYGVSSPNPTLPNAGSCSN